MSSLACGGSLAVNCPRYAEAIYKHAEANRPERLLKCHFDGPFFRQCFNYTLCLCLVLEAKGAWRVYDPVRCEGGQIDRAAIVEAEIPVTFLIAGPERTRTAQHDGDRAVR